MKSTMTPHLRVVKPNLDRQLIVPVSAPMLRALRAEARHYGYSSLAAFIRDFKLGMTRHGEGDDIAS